MSLDAAFLEFMPHSIYEYPLSGFNEYAEEAYSTTPNVYQCMIEERPDMVRNQFGDEVVSSHIVYIASTSRLPLTSQYAFYTSTGDSPPIIRGDAFSDETGEIHHVALMIGSGVS
jgi:hypothetical protein